MSELNPNAKLWVEALRSGKYKQGKHALTEVKDGVEFDCCLGVACKVAIDNGLQLETHIGEKHVGRADKRDIKQVRFYDSTSYGTLPHMVAEWLGLQTEDASYKVLSLMESMRVEEEPIRVTRALTEDNDGGRTFTEIAAIVELQPEGLFK